MFNNRLWIIKRLVSNNSYLAYYPSLDIFSTKSKKDLKPICFNEEVQAYKDRIINFKELIEFIIEGIKEEIYGQ